jgi:hypothetical protein
VLSVIELLKEHHKDVDFFDIKKVDGVEMVCWGMKKISHALRGKVVEIAMDATCT